MAGKGTPLAFLVDVKTFLFSRNHHVAYTVVAQGEWLSGSINWVSKGEDGRVSGGQERGADGMGSRNQQQAGGWRAPGGRPGPGESVQRGGERQGRSPGWQGRAGGGMGSG